MYKVHCPNFDACFQKKCFNVILHNKKQYSCSSLKSSSTSMKFNFIYKIWCKLFNALSVWWYIKFYDVFFCCFTAAQSNAIHLCNAYCITFFERGDLEWARHSLATWQDSRWRRILHNLFSSKSFHICAKKPQDIPYFPVYKSNLCISRPPFCSQKSASFRVSVYKSTSR